MFQLMVTINQSFTTVLDGRREILRFCLKLSTHRPHFVRFTLLQRQICWLVYVPNLLSKDPPISWQYQPVCENAVTVIRSR